MIRKATTTKDLEKIHELASYAFNISHTEEQKQAYIKKNHHTINYVMENNHDIHSQIIVYPFEVNIHDRVMRMAGIGDVATYPEARGTGSIRQLFQAIFKDLHENGTELSYLAPFSQIFYRKFGYENLFNNQELRFPKLVLNQIKPVKTGKTKRASWHDLSTKETIKKLYQKTLGQEHGSLIRPDFWWEHYLRADKQLKFALTYNDNDEATGYLIYQLIGNQEFIIKELAYVNIAAFKQLLNFVSSHNGSFNEFVSHDAKNSMLLTQFSETQEITQKNMSGMMGRIINFKQFIENFSFKEIETEETFYIEVIDDMCSWNHGTFKICIQNGVATCEKSEFATVDYYGTIQAWLPVLMGVHSLEQSIFYELIERKTTNHSLSDLIPTTTPRLYDYF